VAVSARAAEVGINVRPLSTSYVPGAERGSTPARGLLLGYSRLAPGRIDEAVEALAAVVRADGRN
jgi:DNA-binding transcriptional MocR family regulator